MKSSEDLDLEIQLLALQVNHAKRKRRQAEQKEIITQIKAEHLAQYREFRKKQKQIFANYLPYGAGVYLGSIVLTRSLFVFPPIVTLAGYAYYVYKNSSQPQQKQ